MSNGTLTYEYEGLRLSVAFDRYYGSRCAWLYVIGTDDETLCQGTDLETPTYDMSNGRKKDD